MEANVVGTARGITDNRADTNHNFTKAAAFIEAGQPLWVYIHELGHALGLTHPNHTVASDDPHYNIDTTIMSSNYGQDLGQNGYTSATRLPTTPMIYDIAAIQSIYGANTTYNNDPNAPDQGNTTYRFSGISTASTIWDGGGTDILNADDQTTGVTLDLREGFDAAGKQYVNLVGNEVVFIAFNANIENAKGGSGNDHIFGNALNNILWGEGGSDTIDGGAGSDVVNYADSAVAISYKVLTGVVKQGVDTDTLSNVETIVASTAKTDVLDFSGTGVSTDKLSVVFGRDASGGTTISSSGSALELLGFEKYIGGVAAETFTMSKPVGGDYPSQPKIETTLPNDNYVDMVTNYAMVA